MCGAHAIAITLFSLASSIVEGAYSISNLHLNMPSNFEQVFTTNDVMPSDHKHYITLFMLVNLAKDASPRNCEPDKYECAIACGLDGRPFLKYNIR